MRSLFSALVLLALLILTGCSDPSAVVEREWTLVTASGETAITLPAHVDDRVPHDTTYTLVRVVAVDPAWRGRDLTLVIPRLFAHVKLKVGDRQIEPLDGEDLHAYRGRGPHVWRFSAPAADTMTIALVVDHTWTQSGWLDTPPRISTDPEGGRTFVLDRAFNSLTAAGAIGFALFAGYLYLAIFLSDRRRTEFGWFALTGLSGFTYPLFQSGLLASYLGPFETVMAAAGVSTAVVAEIHFTAAYFKLPRPSRLWNAAWLVAMILAFASVGYYTNTRIAGIATIALATPAIGSQAVLLVRLAGRRPLPRDLFSVLGGWAILSMVCIPDFVAWLGLGEILGGTRTACLGIFVIGLLQTATVSRAHMRSLGEAETLNEELRRQVAARSRQLADALARLGVTPGERTLAAGEIVEGRYEVVRVLGAGAGGTVYLVVRLSDRVELAMKIVRDNDAHALARLAREAQLAAEVKHEHVISIVDVDIAASGFLYVVMEYIAGDSLREHKLRYGELPWALTVLGQIAEGLVVIHARGIIHRDLKPANVLLLESHDGPPIVKITDFGIARAEHAARVTGRPPSPDQRSDERTFREGDARLTATGVLMGTPLYMAPEAVGGAREATSAVDVFAFGIIAYELITGRLPFRESPALVQLEGMSVAPAPPLLTVRADCPADVARIVDRCLSLEPEDRPTAHQAAAVVGRAIEGKTA